MYISIITGKDEGYCFTYIGFLYFFCDYLFTNFLINVYCTPIIRFAKQRVKTTLGFYGLYTQTFIESVKVYVL